VAIFPKQKRDYPWEEEMLFQSRKPSMGQRRMDISWIYIIEKRSHEQC